MESVSSQTFKEFIQRREDFYYVLVRNNFFLPKINSSIVRESYLK